MYRKAGLFTRACSHCAMPLCPASFFARQGAAPPFQFRGALVTIMSHTCHIVAFAECETFPTFRSILAAPIREIAPCLDTHLFCALQSPQGCFFFCPFQACWPTVWSRAA